MHLRRTLKLAASCLALVGAIYGVRAYLAHLAPIRATKDLLTAVEQRDWHAVYRFSPTVEYRDHNISEAQFVTMMTELCKGLGPLVPISDRTVETGIPGEHLEIMTF